MSEKHLEFEDGLPNMTEYTQGFFAGRRWERENGLKNFWYCREHECGGTYGSCPTCEEKNA